MYDPIEAGQRSKEIKLETTIISLVLLHQLYLHTTTTTYIHTEILLNPRFWAEET